MRGVRGLWRFAPHRDDTTVAMVGRVVFGVALVWVLAGTAFAGGPRFLAGPPYYTAVSGSPVGWKTKSLRYWTDPGDLSSAVNHAAADAMVATAASAWNVPVASITVSQGGVLAEDVNGSNVYMGSSGPVFPADVQAANAASVQVAVIYDADGAVTDMLLGGGASDPGNCRQSAVTDSVDSITQAGAIAHAVLVVNGRCTGTAAEIQMEMTYRLVRAFGRILGVGWSQLNDNVFTGSPLPTYAQVMHWPVMHPIDLMCGPYAYQCMPQPFVIRPDDIGTMVLMYPETGGDAGKIPSFQKATTHTGVVSFPNGQGMQGVNVVARRYNGTLKEWDLFEAAGSVTGYGFQLTGASPLASKGTGLAGSLGSLGAEYEGRYVIGWMPIDANTTFENVSFTTQAINPLYTGQYAVGPYGKMAQVTPSGSPVTYVQPSVGPGGQQTNYATITDAPGACAATADGTWSAPVSVDPTGMWQSVLCGFGHMAWWKVPVKGGRTLTLEVTAVDEKGLATVGKMQPVFGVWATTDPNSLVPTVATAGTPMNTGTLGMTAVGVSNGTARTLRIGMGDVRGDGRPDYGYKVRVLYADSVTPVALPANGGSITISGMGFRNGNAVLVNGVAAEVLSWSANTIVALAPALVGVVSADVTVMDVSTAGQTTMSGAIAYSGVSMPDGVSVVSVPADGSALGVAASTVFGVKVVLPDGVSPAVGVAVGVSATHGAGLVGCGGAAVCSMVTDGGGMVRTAVTPSVSGTVALGAVVGTVTASASFVAGSVVADALRVTSLPGGLVYAGVAAGLPWIVQAMQGDGVTPDAGAQVSLVAQGAGLGGCGGVSACVLVADGLGLVATTVTPSGAGVVSLQASAGGGMVAASFGALAMPADGLRVVSAPVNGAWVGSAAAGVFQVQVMLGDGVTQAAGARVTLSAMGAGLGACGGASACVLMADGTGMVSTGVTPSAEGTVTLVASAGGGTVHTTFAAVNPPPDRLELVSMPASGLLVGTASGVAFRVRLLSPDGVTPVVGAGVTLTVTGGTLGVCGAASCVVTTDATGAAGSSVTASAAGRVGLVATGAGVSLSNAFTAVVDGVRLVSVPVLASYVGVPTRTPVVFQVLLPDGVTPGAGATVTMTTTLGTLGACGLPVCVMTADGQGMVSSVVNPVAEGVVTVRASAGGGTGGTSFYVFRMPPDIVHILSVPSGTVYTGVTALQPLTLQVLLGDNFTPDVGMQIHLYSPNVNLASSGCGTACTQAADAHGLFSSTVVPLKDGTVTIAIRVWNAGASASFVSVPLGPDLVTLVSSPADGAVPGKATAAPFAVQAMLGDGRTAAANAAVTMTATGATLGACGRASCVVTSSAAGTASTTVTPTADGTVRLTAAVGGGSVTASFVAATQRDVLRVVSAPADGAFVGRVAAGSFQVKVMLGDGVTAASGAVVTLTASNGMLGACGGASCAVTADASGMVSSAVTPLAAGTVGLMAAAVGGTATASFLAVVVPPDVLTVVSAPANGAFVGRAASAVWRVKAALWDGTAAAGAQVTLTATNAGMGGCGGQCVLVADASGMVSVVVTPSAAGVVTLTAAAGGGTLTAAAGGGTVSSSFAAVVVPADVLTVVSVPLNGGYVGRVAGGSFGVRVVLGDGTVGAGASVTLTASGGTMGACGSSSCVMLADGAGMVSTAVTPSAAGIVGLTASAGGGPVSASFTAVVVPADVLTVFSVPGNGGYVGRVAGGAFGVRVVLGDGTVGAGASVTLTASGGTMGACGSSSCVVLADGAGMVSTVVTPSAAGIVGLTASAGGGTVSASFTAVVVPPDVLTVVSVPASGAHVGSLADGVFAVKVMFGDGTVGAGAAVTLTASAGALGVCGAGSCVVVADAAGMVSSAVTPGAVGTVALTASAGGGMASGSFTAVAVPVDLLTMVSMPANGAYVGYGAGIWRVRVTLGDGVTVAAGVSVSLSASGGTLGACGSSACVLVADGSGFVSTSVTATAAGVVGLTASAGGGTVAASFTAVTMPPDGLTVVSVPANGAYVGYGAGTWRVKVMLGDGVTVAAGVSVSLSASGGTLGACGSSSCVLVADGTGMVSTSVTATAAGVVGLVASAGGGTVAASFRAVTMPPDGLTVVSVPASGGYVGDAAGTWGVKVMLGDGVTVGAGAQVSLSASGGTLAACGSGSCVLTADGAGMVSTSVTATASGVVGLRATAGGGVVTASFTAVDHVPGIAMAQAVEYVAAGAQVSWTPRVSMTMDGAAVVVPVSWTGGTGMVVGASSGSSDAVAIGPLGAGGTASGQACAWGTVCVGFGAVVVDEAEWGLTMVSGGGQAVGVGGAFDPVVVRVVDGAGHGVAGVPVTVWQRMNGYVACPAVGRCAVGPVLGFGTAVVVSDGDGMVTVAPMGLSGVGETTGMVLTAGSNGFLSTSVSMVP